MRNSFYLGRLAANKRRMDGIGPRLVRPAVKPYKYKDGHDIATYTHGDFIEQLRVLGVPPYLAQLYARETRQRRVINTNDGSHMIYSIDCVHGKAVIDREVQDKNYVEELFTKLKTSVEMRAESERRLKRHVRS